MSLSQEYVTTSCTDKLCIMTVLRRQEVKQAKTIGVEDQTADNGWMGMRLRKAKNEKQAGEKKLCGENTEEEHYYEQWQQSPAITFVIHCHKHTIFPACSSCQGMREAGLCMLNMPSLLSVHLSWGSSWHSLGGHFIVIGRHLPMASCAWSIKSFRAFMPLIPPFTFHLPNVRSISKMWRQIQFNSIFICIVPIHCRNLLTTLNIEQV